MARVAVALAVCALLAALGVANGQYGLTVGVTTRNGNLTGLRKATGPNRHVHVFYNIPYAKPPTGARRFQKPEAYGAWGGWRDAIFVGPMCPQPNRHPTSQDDVVLGQEDCLVLNVYTPQDSRPASSGLLPVMVWVHGGGFGYGRGHIYDAMWLADRGVVVVTINYRLGALGFLSTGDAEIPGNLGLWDQILALRWVRDAITDFNGNPNDVTLFGESAGAMSTSLLTLTPEAKGLFSKAIMQSGVSLSLGPRVGGSGPALANLAASLGCPARPSASLKACLMQKSAAQIVTGLRPNPGQVSWAPVFESTFGQAGLFSALPEVTLRTGNFNNVSAIRGFNKDEFVANVQAFDPENDGLSMSEWVRLVKTLFVPRAAEAFPRVNQTDVFDLIVKAYVSQPGVTDPKDLRHALGLAMTDFTFIAPTFKEQSMWLAAHGKPEFCYCVTHRSVHAKSPAWQGVSHTDEIQYVFGGPLNPGGAWERAKTSRGGYTVEDRAFSNMLITMWTDFAKYGTPTPAGSGYPSWSESVGDASNFMDLKVQPQMEQVPAARRPQIDLWNKVLPSMQQQAASLVG